MLAAVSRRFCWPDHDWVGYRATLWALATDLGVAPTVVTSGLARGAARVTGYLVVRRQRRLGGLLNFYERAA